MSDEKKKVKRRAVSKKLRFEVFKRDSFTCQYCGRKAPDIVLHIEHITPVSKGGKNTLMNLVTSCVECNLGKGARTLSDDSSVTKAQKQAELLQDRREQIEMIRDWHLSLVDQSCVEVEAVNSLYSALTNGEKVIADWYKVEIGKLIKKFGLDTVLQALRDGAAGYGSPKKALDKLRGICACKSNPYYRRRGYIAAILKSKVGYWNDANFMPLFKRGYDAGGDAFLDRVEAWAKDEFRGSWTQMMQSLFVAVENWEAQSASKKH